MNLLSIYSRYPDQEACIEHLEDVRWGDTVACPHCGSVKVGRKADNGRVGRWNCHDCHASFNVLSGTLFQKSRIPLQKWFFAIGLIVNAKKSLSSCQLARDLDLRQPTAWYMLHRIRAEMACEQRPLLQGILEADETYLGGKPRKGNKRKDDNTHGNPRGRGTSKTPVIGVVERGGNVAAAVADDLTGRGVLNFIKNSIDPDGSLLITDEYQAYNVVRGVVNHAVIKHKERYADGMTHINSIEGFWASLKRAWYGSHHHYSKNYTPLYVAEACFKYNHRKTGNAFGTFLQVAMA